jgi:ubiquinone/menaquinone biosynthesis C-methylase UbiE
MSYLDNLKNNWEKFAYKDPLWAILTQKDKKGNKWNEKEFFKSGKVEISYLIKQIEKNGMEVSLEKALDFGCGVGRLTQALSEYFSNVVGIDISERMIALAKNYNSKKNCEFFVSDIKKLKLIKSDQFSFIYSNITLQHIKPQFVFMYFKEFQRILKNNGVLVFQLPHKFQNSYFRILRESVFLYNLYLKVKFMGKEKMETYCIRKDKVIDFMKNLSFELILCETDSNAGPKWESYTYYFKKNK